MTCRPWSRDGLGYFAYFPIEPVSPQQLEKSDQSSPFLRVHLDQQIDGLQQGFDDQEPEMLPRWPQVRFYSTRGVVTE